MPVAPAAAEPKAGAAHRPGRLIAAWGLAPGDVAQVEWAHFCRRLARRRPLEATELDDWRRRLVESAAAVGARRAALPALAFPADLPISARRDDIIAAVERHPVVIVAGDTGSGKSTQLPKLCLAAGRGARGVIACTQPRRLAARSLAARVAEELGVAPGGLVGYQVRFKDRSTPATQVKFVTDGILLAAIAGDRQLDAYDTIIVDEAHERSLNIDFLLGYLKQLLPRRPDLKLIVTSATIDTARFAAHFDGAPVIAVEGRTYPVEVRYRPPAEAEDAGQPRTIAAAVDELGALDPRGDILVFLSGEREIHDTADFLRRRNFRHTEILPLYARLGDAAQQRIFHPGAARRIVLATNVAETSLTVPRIRFVIDSGRARVSRYSQRSRLQRLPVEAVSQASAEQRAGRCGRLGPGVCIRLYSADDFAARPPFTEPEILRTSLAGVILRLAALGLGEVEAFPFIEPPPRAMVTDAYHQLFELHAVDRDRRLTPLGRRLARLPIDVRLGRMLLAAEDLCCLHDVLILAAALAVPDPRLRPLDAQQAADEAHARFNDPASDFAALLKLWRWAGEQRREFGAAAYRRALERAFLAPQRIREWQDLRHQLAELCLAAGMTIDAKPASGAALHEALLSGLIGQIGRLDEENGDYLGARGRRFQLFPGSGLARGKAQWVMCAEIVETAKVYGRTAAAIEAAMIERRGAHLLRYRYFDPYWDDRRGRVMGYAQVTLYGLTLAERRRVHYAPHDPESARAVFLEQAVVTGAVQPAAPFVAANRETLAALEAIEQRRRRRGIVPDESEKIAFFAAVVPSGVVDRATFKTWYEAGGAARDRALRYPAAWLEKAQAAELADFPETLEFHGRRFTLHYRFAPGADDDGVTIDVPLTALNRIAAEDLEWLVPGLLREKIAALIGTLPKPLRRALSPAGEFALALIERFEDNRSGTPDRQCGSLLAAVAREAGAIVGRDVATADFAVTRLAAYLTMNIRVLADDGNTIAESRDLATLQHRFGQRARQALHATAGAQWRRDGLEQWDFGALPETVTTADGLPAWPALTAGDGAAGLRLYDDRAEAEIEHAAGLAQLLTGALNKEMRYLAKLPDRVTVIEAGTLGGLAALVADLAAQIAGEVIADPWQVRDPKAFAAALDKVRREIVPRGAPRLEALAVVLDRRRQIRGRMAAIHRLSPPAAADIASQLDDLIYPGFLGEIDGERFAEYPRYLEGIIRRLDRLPSNPARDAARLAEIDPWWRKYFDHFQTHGYSAELDTYRWLIEEYRISLFAQPMKTLHPVSAKRLAAAWQAVLSSG